MLCFTIRALLRLSWIAPVERRLGNPPTPVLDTLPVVFVGAPVERRLGNPPTPVLGTLPVVFVGSACGTEVRQPADAGARHAACGLYIGL